MITRIHENKVWRYSWEMKVVMATMLVGLIFIFAGATASAQVVAEPGLISPAIAHPVGLPIVSPFSPIVRPFPIVNPFIRQLLLRQLLLRGLLLNPFIADADLFGLGLGLGIDADLGIGIGAVGAVD
jgi:hypothetical protein